MHRGVPKPTLCRVTGKKRWPDRRSAIQVLHQAATARYFASVDGVTTSRSEVRAYKCADCRGWHVTSRQDRFAAA